jgi:hypothetical protein
LELPAAQFVDPTLRWSNPTDPRRLRYPSFVTTCPVRYSNRMEKRA